MPLDPALCYRALASRDRRFDGRFFTAVTTTGIYCRPVCPARTPRRENVRFFVCAAAAEAAGFRPCRRCRPESAPGTPAWIGSPALVARALRLIESGALGTCEGATFARRLGVGERQLRRLFAIHVGAAPGAIARARRAHLARRLLGECDLPMTEVAAAAGYESLRQFNHDVRRRYGAPPRALRAGRVLRGNREALELRLSYRPPFEAGALLDFLARRAFPGVEAVSASVWRRAVRTPEGPALVEVTPDTATGHVHLSLGMRAVGSLAAIVGRVRRVFDLDADPALVEGTLSTDRRLARLVRERPGLRVPGAFDRFECAVRTVLGQQVTLRGATTLAGRLVERFGVGLEADLAPGITHLFPDPAALADADLERIGLPTARAASIRGLARAFSRGEIPLDESLGLDELVARFRSLPGIGAWTASVLAMRAFGEPDALPAQDLVLRKALGRGTPVAARAVESAAQAWRPWRSYAVMHLWSKGAAP